MDKVDLNDLPQWSQWPSRLLGLDEWAIASRTLDKIEQEYEQDKYAKCLEFCNRSDKDLTPEDVKQFEFQLAPDQKICASVDNELYSLELKKARAKHYQLIANSIRKEAGHCDSIIELGAGYGYNLWMLKQHFMTKTFGGGEYSANAVKVAARLYPPDLNIRVWHLNFYDPSTYTFLELLPAPFLVFTSHAVEQMPRSGMIFDTLFQYREKIHSVFHFEPLYELHDRTLLGLMRQRYAEINDYNRDLLSELKHRSYVQIADIQRDVFGINPLNPTSIVQWKFSN